MVAHHSVLVVEAFGSIEKAKVVSDTHDPAEHKLIKDLLYTQEHLDARNLSESWHDLLQVKEESQKMFDLGLLTLDVKAKVETLFWQTAERMQKMASKLDPDEVPEDLGELPTQLADQHICNFSVFQSLLDHWALGALFPIVPIHRLNERPASQSTLVDITCDSDGKVNKFIDRADVRDTLPLHNISDAPYYLGVFLTGAYQDIMGDMHNLFGRVNEVHVFLDDDEDDGYYLEETIAGNTIGEVLQFTQYMPHDLVAKVKAQIDNAIKQDKLRPNEGMRLVADYERGLKEQTYLKLR
jgi:arginine decarboxylase